MAEKLVNADDEGAGDNEASENVGADILALAFERMRGYQKRTDELFGGTEKVPGYVRVKISLCIEQVKQYGDLLSFEAQILVAAKSLRDILRRLNQKVFAVAAREAKLAGARFWLRRSPRICVELFIFQSNANPEGSSQGSLRRPRRLRVNDIDSAVTDLFAEIPVPEDLRETAKEAKRMDDRIKGLAGKAQHVRDLENEVKTIYRQMLALRSAPPIDILVSERVEEKPSEPETTGTTESVSHRNGTATEKRKRSDKNGNGIHFE